MIWPIAFAVAFVKIGDPWNGFWYGTWAILLYGLAFAITVQALKLVHWSVALMLLSFMVSSLYICAWPGSLPFQSLDKVVTAQRNTAVALVCGLMLFLGISRVPRKGLEAALEAFGWAVIVSACWVFIMRFWRMPTLEFAWGGLYGNPSMSACIMAIAIPWLPNWRARVFVAAACLASRNSMGAGVLGVVLAAWGVSSGFLRWWWPGVAALGFLGAGYLWQGDDFFSSSGRTLVWKWEWEKWTLVGNHWIGDGPGTLFNTLPELQRARGHVAKNSAFSWLHADWYEILIVLGALGLAAALNVYGHALWFARKNPKVFASLSGLGAMAAANYPFHQAASAFLFVVVLALAFSYAPLHGLVAREQELGVGVRAAGGDAEHQAVSRADAEPSQRALLSVQDDGCAGRRDHGVDGAPGRDGG